MKNNITIFAALLLLLTVGFGCGFLDKSSSGGGNSSNTASNSSDPNAVAKTGIPECDEFIELLEKDMNDPNDGFLARKGKQFVIDTAKEQIKKSIEENNSNKQEIIKGCKEGKEEYLKKKEKNNSNSTEKSGNTQKS